MKKSAFLSLMFLVCLAVQGQQEIKSKIISAKVYTQGAELKREANLELTKGKNEFKITNLSEHLDPKTIQVTGQNITILSVRHEKDFIETNTPEKVKDLWARFQMIKDSIEVIELKQSILEQESKILTKNLKVVGEDGVKDEKYQESLEYLTNKFEKNANSYFNLSLKARELTERLNKLEAQIKSHNSKEREYTSNIFLVINAEEKGKEKIEISYALSEAGWFPSYDIRAVDVSSPLAITYKARVFQNSGIDWKNVKLTLSSGDLESSGTAPQLNPFYVGSIGSVYKPVEYGDYVVGRVIGEDDGLPLPQVGVIVKGTTVGVATNADGEYKLQMPKGSSTLIFRYLGYVTQEIETGYNSVLNVMLSPDATSLGEVVVTGVAAGTSTKKLGFDVAKVNVNGGSYSSGGYRGSSSKGTQIKIRGSNSINGSLYGSRAPVNKPLPMNVINYQTSFVYEIKVPYDIPSTGQPEFVDIQTVEAEADYIYSASPKAKENAYLVAEVPEWEKLKLLDGESNLYFEDSFVGKSLIDTSIGKDTLDISLGKDEGIVINRERLKNFEQNKLFSNKKREERKYEITVVNTKSTSININIYDQLPLATNKNVKVIPVELSEGKVDKESGLVLWNFKLAPGEKKVIPFSFYVDLPKYIDLEID